MILYCQECGQKVDFPDWGVREELEQIKCNDCGAVFDRGQVTLDEFLAQLMFPPQSTAA